MKFVIPSTMQIEHEQLHAELARALKAGGKTGEAAREVERVLHPHFLKEEEFALPPLGLLPDLASGKILPEMREAVTMAHRLREELGQMQEEHRAVIRRLRALSRAAEEEGKPACLRFAKDLILHARAEEEVFYPAAILVGEYLELRLGRAGREEGRDRHAFPR